MNYKILAPLVTSEDQILKSKYLPPFSSQSVEFIDALSKNLMKNASLRNYPELISLAFWMRKSHIDQLKKKYEKYKGDKLLVPCGKIFHITPSNVDTIFVYSWLLSLLIGNINILRVSSKNNTQVEILIDEINKILSEEKFEDIRSRVMIIRYAHDESITAHFSNLCDMRVIWGGDQTIKSVRSIPIKPTSKELTFADKSSFTIIKSKEFISAENKEKIIDSFYNDSYVFFQNACSSPRLIVWAGDTNDIIESKAQFWRLFESKVGKENPKIPAKTIMDKLVSTYSLGMSYPVKIERTFNNLINRINFDKIEDVNFEFHCGGGLFYESSVKELKDIAPIITRKNQTVTYFGFSKDELYRFVTDNLITGIDRFVPFGSALEFSSIWDGYDLLLEFCREIEIQ